MHSLCLILLNTVGRNEPTKQIFWKQYGFANPKPRIRTDLCLFKVRLCSKDLWGFVGFVKIGWIFEKCVTNRIHESESLRIRLANPDLRIYEVGFVNHETNRTFLESGFVITIQNESMFYDSLIRFPQP
jgi:hypothetical protein